MEVLSVLASITATLALGLVGLSVILFVKKWFPRWWTRYGRNTLHTHR